MEQTALRPKPMPGRDPAGTARGSDRHPHAARRRGRRVATLLLGLCAGLLLVLSGVGIGTVGAAVIGMNKMSAHARQGAGPGAAPAPSARSTPGPGPAPVSMTLGVEAVDDDRPGARVVGVHVPGPGYSAGLVRGDVLLVFGGARIGSAADLAHAVARARPGRTVTLTVRHRSGGYQQLTATLGIVT
ncbi:PDZ domain-containing protein [Streptomyces sp. NPDC086766]|uniref:PDZ domain-containing protein n=1 Tax=Streptomyces sp. NPDC086766 TaxID=3365754 RepID=UPI0038293658